MTGARDIVRLLLHRARQRGAVMHVAARMQALDGRLGALCTASEEVRKELPRGLPAAGKRDLIVAAARSGQQPGAFVEQPVEGVRRSLSVAKDSLITDNDKVAEIGSAIDHLSDLISEASH